MNPFLRQPAAHQRTPIRAEVPAAKQAEGVATLRLYDPIDSYGGFWGVSAKEFTATLDSLPDDTTEIRLLINSPGGEVYEGLAILNALRAHPAKVVAVVEGIAASSASFIAAGADELQIMQNAELFVHNAWGIVVGPAEVMAKMAADLQHTDRNLASIYAKKSGGTVDEWLAAMEAETFYSADEAVAAKLADKVIEPPKGSDPKAQAQARFDLSALTHTRPAEPAITNHNPEGADMTSDTLISGLRARLGVSAELDEPGLLAALDEALQERAEDTDGGPDIPQGTVLVDQATLDQLRASAALGVEARDQQIREHREQVVNAAVTDGRIPPARTQAWLDMLAVDPGAEQTLASLQKGTVPLAAVGHSGGVEQSEEDRFYTEMFGDDGKVA